MPQRISNQTDKNYDAFTALLPDIIGTQEGKFALLHDSELVSFFDSSISAYVEGVTRYGIGGFSVQEVTNETENLGFYSYAGYPGQA